jgi:hypothetical protein
MTDSSGVASIQDLRTSCRIAKSACLATNAIGHKQVDDGWPTTSMVVPAIDIDGTPILLISDLADHTRHIAADHRVSLLFGPSGNNSDATIETDTARLTLFGRAIRDNGDAIRACYLRANPDAALYADFADFGFYRVTVEAIYWVGGFGKQRRLAGHQFIEPDCHPLVLAQADIIHHMNADHLDALSNIVGHYSSQDPKAGWQMHSIDCDGMVLRQNDDQGRTIRIDFTRTVHNPGEARDILVEMSKKSRT